MKSNQNLYDAIRRQEARRNPAYKGRYRTEEELRTPLAKYIGYLGWALIAAGVITFFIWEGQALKVDWQLLNLNFWLPMPFALVLGGILFIFLGKVGGRLGEALLWMTPFYIVYTALAPDFSSFSFSKFSKSDWFIAIAMLVGGLILRFAFMRRTDVSSEVGQDNAKSSLEHQEVEAIIKELTEQFRKKHGRKPERSVMEGFGQEKDEVAMIRQQAYDEFKRRKELQKEQGTASLKKMMNEIKREMRDGG